MIKTIEENNNKITYAALENNINYVLCIKKHKAPQNLSIING